MNKKNNNSGIGLTTVLFLIFLVLKLCKIINWSWLWIFSPLWIGSILWILIYLIIYLYYKRHF